MKETNMTLNSQPITNYYIPSYSSNINVNTSSSVNFNNTLYGADITEPPSTNPFTYDLVERSKRDVILYSEIKEMLVIDVTVVKERVSSMIDAGDISGAMSLLNSALNLPNIDTVPFSHFRNLGNDVICSCIIDGNYITVLMNENQNAAYKLKH